MYRSVGRGVVMSERGRNFKNTLTSAIVNNPSTYLISGDVEVEVHFEFKDKRKRDVDNYAKAVLDCAKSLLFDDDSDISKLTMTKKIGMPMNRFEIVVCSKSDTYCLSN